MKKEPNKEREFGIILEKIHSDFKIFAEDLSSVKKRLDSLFEEMGRQKEDIFIIKADIRIMKTDIAGINSRLAKIEEDVTTIKTDFGKRLAHLETLK